MGKPGEAWNSVTSSATTVCDGLLAMCDAPDMCSNTRVWVIQARSTPLTIGRALCTKWCSRMPPPHERTRATFLWKVTEIRTRDSKLSGRQSKTGCSTLAASERSTRVPMARWKTRTICGSRRLIRRAGACASPLHRLLDTPLTRRTFGAAFAMLTGQTTMSSCGAVWDVTSLGTLHTSVVLLAVC